MKKRTKKLLSVQSVAVDRGGALAAALLPGAQFFDAYRVAVFDPALDVRAAAARGFGQPPGWVAALMAVRNAVVAPLGLKTPRPGAAGAIGIFPVLRETADHLVVGLDDTHLDFRACLAMSTDGAGRWLTLTTAVRTHNAPGRAYLASIMPFHRLVVRSMLRRAVG